MNIKTIKSIAAAALCAVGFTATAAEPEAVQLWEGGPYWAECNVGATKPEEYGYYFWWGDTVGYKHDGSKWVSVKDSTTSIQFSSSDATAKQTYNHDKTWLESNGWIDSTGNLVVSDDASTNHDAARAHLGAPWRMMTKADLDALLANCDVYSTDNWNNTGLKGKIVRGRGDYSANSIFLPAAGVGTGSSLANPGSDGYYWCSTPYSNSNSSACYLSFDSHSFYANDMSRYYGQSVRAVRDAN